MTRRNAKCHTVDDATPHAAEPPSGGVARARVVVIADADRHPHIAHVHVDAHGTVRVLVTILGAEPTRAGALGLQGVVLSTSQEPACD